MTGLAPSPNSQVIYESKSESERLSESHQIIISNQYTKGIKLDMLMVNLMKVNSTLIKQLVRR